MNVEFHRVSGRTRAAVAGALLAPLMLAGCGSGQSAESCQGEVIHVGLHVNDNVESAIGRVLHKRYKHLEHVEDIYGTSLAIYDVLVAAHAARHDGHYTPDRHDRFLVCYEPEGPDQGKVSFPEQNSIVLAAN